MSLPFDFPFVEVGDKNAQLESWELSGLLSGSANSNTDSGRLYVSIESAGPTVHVYKDKARTGQNEVASGTGPVGTTVALAAVNASGITGSVFLRDSTFTSSIDLFVTLCSEFDLVKADDRIVSFLLEDGDGQGTAETDFSDILKRVSRQFYTLIQYRYPPRPSLANPLMAHGNLEPTASGAFGQNESTTAFMWTMSAAGEYQLTGLQNPGDYREWAILYARFLVWDRRARSTVDDAVFLMAENLRQRSEEAFGRIKPWVDVDADKLPDRQAAVTGWRFRRG